MLQIVEVENIAFFFRCLQSPSKIHSQTCIDGCGLLIGGNVFLNLSSLLIEIIVGKLFQGFFNGIPPRIKLFPDIGIQVFQIAIGFSPHGKP